MQNVIIDESEDLLTLNFEFNVNCVELQETTNVSSLTISADLTVFDFYSDNKYHTVLIDDNDALLTDVKHCALLTGLSDNSDCFSDNFALHVKVYLKLTKQYDSELANLDIILLLDFSNYCKRIPCRIPRA